MIDATRPLYASLSVPTEATMIGTGRVFVERVLGDLTSPRSLDDLRVAVGEACASMRGTRLHVALEVSEERGHVSCRGVRAPDDDVMRAQRAAVGMNRALPRCRSWCSDI